MSDAARTLPALNEKPTAREALRAMPFVWRMVWEADRPSVVLQLLGAALAYGSYAGFVYLSGAFTTALQASNWAVVGWVIGWFALAEGADVLSNYLYEFYSDRIRYRTEVYMKARQFDVLAKLPYWVIEHPTFRALQHAMVPTGTGCFCVREQSRLECEGAPGIPCKRKIDATNAFRRRVRAGHV
jgi:hypothetical protein